MPANAVRILRQIAGDDQTDASCWGGSWTVATGSRSRL